MAISSKVLLDSLDGLTEFDKEYFELIRNPDFEAITLNAVLYRGRWLPKSRMRTDFDGNIYVENWLAAKL